MAVVILLADGVRPDTLADAMASGELPALARLRDEGTLATVTTCFPSVTGPAYAPFLMGRYPGPIGLPGLRWVDRSRTRCTFPSYSRSYVGYQMREVDRDLDPGAPTIFELAGSAVGAMSVICRGLRGADRIGRIRGFDAIRAAWMHFRGDVRASLAIDRDVASLVAERIRRERPEFVFAAFGAPDKTSHAFGHRAPVVRDAIATVDAAAAAIRADAERDGRWRDLQLWVTSDHGHSPVRQHDDLARGVAALGYRVMAHPWTLAYRPQVGVMVSGNAMAHLYLSPANPRRALWPDAARDWSGFVDVMEERPSVDLVILPTADGAVVRARGRGEAAIVRRDGLLWYDAGSGDPLGIGTDLRGVGVHEAHEATIATDYPDSVVQIAALATAPRSGDIILSAARDWDLRARYEPIDHVSSHGALHREHMLVPLLLNRRLAADSVVRRTVDVMPAALRALGRPVPQGLDGEAFDLEPLSPTRPSRIAATRPARRRTRVPG